MRLYHATGRDAGIDLLQQGFRDGDIWLQAEPPKLGTAGGLLEVDINVPERELQQYERTAVEGPRAYLVPARWIARHATVRVNGGLVRADGPAAPRDTVDRLPHVLLHVAETDGATSRQAVGRS